MLLSGCRPMILPLLALLAGCATDDFFPTEVTLASESAAAACTDGAQQALCVRDADRDGVVDSSDRCPATRQTTRVDSHGCALDRDNDGILNNEDACQDSAPDQRVDSKGCTVLHVVAVEFAPGSAELPAADRARVAALAERLDPAATSRLELAGHTDSRGELEANQDLSHRRARAIFDVLIQHGIDGTRLHVQGYGERYPIASNATMAGRTSNRRVEVIGLD